jgi:hypothetical protein
LDVGSNIGRCLLHIVTSLLEHSVAEPTETMHIFAKKMIWLNSFLIGPKVNLKVSKSQKHFFLKLHCPKNE